MSALSGTCPVVGLQEHTLVPHPKVGISVSQGGEWGLLGLWCPPLGKWVWGPPPAHGPRPVGSLGVSPQQLQQPPLHVADELLLPCLLGTARGLPLQGLPLRPLQC